MTENPRFYCGQVIDTYEDAQKSYETFAKERGFAVRLGKSQTSSKDSIVRKRDFLCHRQGKATSKTGATTMSTKPRKRVSSRCDCQAMLRISLQNDMSSSNHNKWMVLKFIDEHSHELLNAAEINTIAAHLLFTEEQEKTIALLKDAGRSAAS